jgi:hypothetical protein
LFRSKLGQIPPAKAGFCCGVCNPGVLPLGCQLFEGGTTGVHHDAARTFARHDVHTSARASESFHRFESGSHEPNHQSAQSAPVPTQCRRRANFRAALRVRAPNRYHKAWEIRGRRRRDVEEVGCAADDVAFSNQERSEAGRKRQWQRCQRFEPFGWDQFRRNLSAIPCFQARPQISPVLRGLYRSRLQGLHARELSEPRGPAAPAQLGYYQGPLDGVVGPQTGNAEELAGVKRPTFSCSYWRLSGQPQG